MAVSLAVAAVAGLVGYLNAGSPATIGPDNSAASSHGHAWPVSRTSPYGSDAGRLPAGEMATSLAVDPATGGYWVLRSDGSIDAFHAPSLGSLAGTLPAGVTATAIAAGRRGGYLVLTSAGGPAPPSLAGRVWSVIPTRRKVVALTFDIGPTDGVPSILRTLRRDHVRATFFVTGRVARQFPAAVRAIAAAGELVGDHSNNHPHFTRISDQRIGEEVIGARFAIEAATGVDVQPWFRFPFGDSDARAIARVNATGFVPIGWTVDTLGWMGASKGISANSVVSRVLASRRPGEIVLMHGGSDTPGDYSTPDADALPTVISRLRADGYSFRTVDELMTLTADHRVPNGLVRGFGAQAYGSDAGRLPEQVPAIGLAVDPASGGYWILRSTGVVDSFNAPAIGQLAGQLPAGVVPTAIAYDVDHRLLVLTSDGGVYSFGPRAA